MDKSTIVQAYAAVVIGCFGLLSFKGNKIEEWSPLLIDRNYVEIEQEAGQQTAPVNLTLLGKPDADILARGKSLYNQNCMFCHGEKGLGDGAAGVAMNPKPRNFKDTGTWVNGKNYAGMFKTLKSGAGTLMAPYDTLPVEDRIAMIEYIREEFQGSGKVAVSQAEIEEMDSLYSLASGVKAASKIPVPKAIQIVAEEELKKVERYKQALELLLSADYLPGQKQFVSIVADGESAIKILSENRVWRSDSNSLAMVVSGSNDSRAFKASSAFMSKEDWELLYQFLRTMI
jgi:mono/diheme cytochrome c family protein